MKEPVTPCLPRALEGLIAATKLLPETDGIPLESPWHLHSLALLLQVLSYHWRDRHDYYAGANMFLYYSVQQLRSETFKGPDFFYVSGVVRDRPRDFWAVWMEDGKYPDIIIEFTSPATAEVDHTTKKDIYEQVFHTSEYYCFDPVTNRLEGWQLANGKYRERTPDERGWLWSQALQLWLGPWIGHFQTLDATWLRFYDAEGRLVLLEGEAERQQAEAANQRARTERERAEAAQQRAETAEAKLARVQAWLTQQGLPPQPPDNAT